MSSRGTYIDAISLLYIRIYSLNDMIENRFLYNITKRKGVLAFIQKMYNTFNVWTVERKMDLTYIYTYRVFPSQTHSYIDQGYQFTYDLLQINNTHTPPTHLLQIFIQPSFKSIVEFVRPNVSRINLIVYFKMRCIYMISLQHMEVIILCG